MVGMSNIVHFAAISRYRTISDLIHPTSGKAHPRILALIILHCPGPPRRCCWTISYRGYAASLRALSSPVMAIPFSNHPPAERWLSREVPALGIDLLVRP